MKVAEKYLRENYPTLTEWLHQPDAIAGMFETICDAMEAYASQKPEQVGEIDFGDYVIIEQKRYGCDNEMYTHKVIGRLESNTYVDVPVQSPAKETYHNDMQKVVRCICCGVSETEVLKYRIEDVKISALKQGRESGEYLDDEKVHDLYYRYFANVDPTSGTIKRAFMGLMIELGFIPIHATISRWV